MSLVSRQSAVAVVAVALLTLPASVMWFKLDARSSDPVQALSIPAPREPAVSPSHRPDELWVCADPNNLPFSNELGEGFENRIAALVAQELGQRLRYFWQPERRGFVRTTLAAGQCDLIVGVPSRFDPVATTIPYYRSTYVFVTRPGQRPVRSFDDPRLSRMRIGIQLTGEDYENPPPAQALARRHLSAQVRGYTVYGDYSVASPQRAVIDAVADGAIDAAVTWGPLAGYFASISPTRLSIVPVPPDAGDPGLRFAFDIAMGVRRRDRARLEQINRVIETRRAAIDAVLREYHIPVMRRNDVALTTRVSEGR
jgi:mxaJ protein